MEMYIIAGIGVLAAIIAYFVGSHASDSKVMELKEKLDAMASRPVSSSKSSGKSSGKKKTTSKNEPSTKAKDNKKMMDLKETVKKTKNQLHNAKAEIKTLKESAKSNKKSTQANKSAKQDADVIFQLREEVGELKGALEAAKTKTNKQKKEKLSAPVAERVETEGMDDSSKQIIHELETTNRTKLKSLTEKHRKAEKEIRQKLRSASGNVDKQRRRADNNDRAYKITQRQVDALQERIAFLEKGPDDKPVVLQVATAAAAVESVPSAPTTTETRVTSQLPVAEGGDRSTTQTNSPILDRNEDAAPVGLTAPSEPTTIEMSPDIAESLFNEGGEGAKLAVSVDSLVASPSSVEEEPSRKTMRLNEVRSTTELDAVPESGQSDSSAVDDAWAEFDVD